MGEPSPGGEVAAAGPVICSALPAEPETAVSYLTGPA
jgi:hypothetical protein